MGSHIRKPEGFRLNAVPGRKVIKESYNTHSGRISHCCLIYNGNSLQYRIQGCSITARTSVPFIKSFIKISFIVNLFRFRMETGKESTAFVINNVTFAVL